MQIPLAPELDRSVSIKYSYNDNKMNKDDIKMFDQLGTGGVLEVLKKALINGVNFDLDKSYKINDIVIKNHSILVYYQAETLNSLEIYTDFAQIIAFIHAFLVNDFETQHILHIGVQSTHNDKNEIYILSPIDSAKAIAEGNSIYWLKNSIVNESIKETKELYLLVEGESELTAFPILFKSRNII